MSKFILFLFGPLLLSSYSCEINKKKVRELEIPAENRAENLIPYTVKLTYQHDEKAYTQGLLYYKGRVLESTGSKESWIAEVNLDNGHQEKKVVLDKKYFGEGITILNNRLYQLTWKDKTGFIYDPDSFQLLGTFAYNFEGWGITNDGRHLIISDGTDKIYYLDSLHHEVAKVLHIKENNLPVKKINELEFVEGFIFANQYETNYLLKIDPETGQLVGRVDLSALANEIKRTSPDANVLNGIAYNSETGELLVTGKLWPKAYLITLKQ